MSDKSLFGRPSSLRQAMNRSRLAEAVRSPALIQGLVADRDGYFDIRTVGWDLYWQGCLGHLPLETRQALEDLGKSREAYFASHLNLTSARQYCCDYFRLLRLALSAGGPGLHLIKAVAGLETFGVRGYFDKAAQAAGAISVRHPVYLLSKLREPSAMDDPKFLPLVCLAPSGENSACAPQMFYHYRQIKIDEETGASLLLYPAADLDSRAASFACIERLWTALKANPDPRSRRRAALIADNALAPFLRGRGTVDGPNRGELAFADLGGGTGALVSRLCDRLLATHKEAVAGRSFAWTFVDLGIQDPARHTGARQLRAAMSVAEYEQADYKAWALKKGLETTAPSWDAVLVCRLLNNLSHFTVEATSDRNELKQLAGKAWTTGSPGCHQPYLCLGPPSPCVASLVASNARVRMCGGTSFRQLSLSDYFSALQRLVGSGPIPNPAANAAFFPLRRFNQDSLILADGSSLFERLCAVGELVIIEDVDLTPEILRDHLEEHKLDSLAATDSTDSQHMRSANLLCITRREWTAQLPGKRIWRRYATRSGAGRC